MTKVKKTVLPVLSTYKECMSVTELEQFALQLRRDIVELTRCSGTQSSHLGGQLSVADIIAVLYGKILKLNPNNPRWEKRDRLILSKGHASGIIYAAMAWRGFFKKERLWNEFNRADCILQEHANMDLEGIEAPSGSLGMGLSNGCGMAWAAKLKYKGQQIPFAVYVVLSDGECTEGQTWESAMCASHFKLDNLIAIVDYNKYVISGTIYEIMNLEPFEEKWKSFGWHVQTVADGNDVSQLVSSIEYARKRETAPGRPRLIIAHTKKGKGISFMERDPVEWHSGHLDDKLYEQCMRELGI